MKRAQVVRKAFNVGVGRSIADEEKRHIVEYVYREIVKPRGGKRRHAEYIVSYSDVYFFENLTPEQPPLLRIDWYENYAPWRYYALSEWFYYHKPSLELASPSILPELFWLPDDNAQDFTKADSALRSATAIDPALGDLLAYRRREYGHYGILIPAEEEKYLKKLKKRSTNRR